MWRNCVFALLLAGCDPAVEAPTARLRVVHADRAAPRLTVLLEGAPGLVGELDFAESSLFLPLEAGARSAQVLSDGRELGRGPVELPAGQAVTLMLTRSALGAPRLHAVTHAFAAQTPRTSRVRLVHVAPGLPALAVELGGVTASLEPGSDTGVEGLPFEADAPLPLTLTWASTTWAFVVPALPSQSELLVLVLADAERPSLLVVAPSAVVGLFQPVSSSP